jgi:hypothetical protein
VKKRRELEVQVASLQLGFPAQRFQGLLRDEKKRVRVHGADRLGNFQLDGPTERAFAHK